MELLTKTIPNRIRTVELVYFPEKIPERNYVRYNMNRKNLETNESFLFYSMNARTSRTPVVRPC